MYIRKIKELGYYPANVLADQYGLTIYAAKRLKMGESIMVRDEIGEVLIKDGIAEKLSIKIESEESEDVDNSNNAGDG